jgi:hypothetical protein
MQNFSIQSPYSQDGEGRTAALSREAGKAEENLRQWIAKSHPCQRVRKSSFSSVLR